MHHGGSRRAALLAMMMALAGCDGRPLLYNLAPSQLDLQVLALYQTIDTGNKGQLTRAEADAYFKRRFIELDANHDGFLDEAESSAALPVMGMKSGADMVFRLDINGDGKLSADEFGRLANYLFTRDTNRDGVLTLAEVKVPPADDDVAARENPAAVSTVRADGK